MDQLKVIGGYLAKYHFWLLSVLAIVASLVGWMMARGTLSANYAKGKSEIVGKFDAVKRILDEPTPPNEVWKEKMTALTDEQREKVGEAWETVYEEQKQELKWPDVMGDEFKKWIDENPEKDIPSEWLDNYQNHAIKLEFPKLLTIVDAAAHDAEKGPEGSGPMHKVVWEADSQQAVQKSLAMPTRPDSFRVRLAQEDLWVYRALLSIIADANKDSKYTSRVKRIERLTIGEKAASDFAAGMAGGHIDRIAEATQEGPPGEPAGAPAAEAGEGAVRAQDEGRYVDADGKPQTGGTAKTQQFKRLPVSMQLVIDQREINRFLTLCANSRLPVEVRQLRVNPGEKSSKGGRPAAAAPQAGKRGSAAAPSATQGEPYDVTLDIQGIIYLYNPPDDQKLGVPQDDGTGAPRKGRRRGRKGGGGGAPTEQASATP